MGGTCVWPRMREFQDTETECSAGESDSKMAKVLAPEEIRAGDYVTVLYEVQEVPWYMWCDESAAVPSKEGLRVQIIPKGAGVPYRVHSLCLPFILVKTPSGGMRNLDVRRHKLARLDRTYALAAWKGYKSKSEKKKQV